MADKRRLAGRMIAILVENEYEDLEFWYPFYRMQEEGMTVIGLAPEAGTYKSKHGYPVDVTTGIDEVEATDFDAVIIPGGYAPDKMRRHEQMVDFVRQAFEEDRVVAAICHAGWMLVSAGILKERTATCFFSIKDDLVNAGANYVDEEVVRDGNLITSRTPDDLPAFCSKIIETLSRVEEPVMAVE